MNSNEYRVYQGGEYVGSVIACNKTEALWQAERLYGDCYGWYKITVREIN